MPQLTNQQLLLIETTLIEKYNFKNFDDVRLEIQDHIASEIEAEMENDFTSFEMAFSKVLNKWHHLIFCDKNSRYNSVPKIVSKLWNELDWKYNMYIIPLTLLISFGLIPYAKQVWITYAMYFIGFVGLVLVTYLYGLFNKNKFNTVLSMYAKFRINRYFAVLFFSLLFNLVVNYSDGDFIFCATLFSTVQITLVLVIRTIIMRKNIKIENQLLRLI